MLKQLNKARLCDSTIKYAELTIMRGDSILSVQDARFNTLTALSLSYQKERNTERKKNKFLSKFVKYSLTIGLGGGLLLGYTIK